MLRTPLAVLLLSLGSLVACGSDDAGGGGTTNPLGAGGTVGTAGAAGQSPVGTAGTGGAATGGSSSSLPTAGAGGATAGNAGSAGSTSAPPTTGTSCDKTAHEGEGTYYDADGSGNCSFDKAPDDVEVAAMNAADYASSATCGTCIAIKGPKGNVRVRIVDQCPECKKGDVDLHPGAFDKLADRSAGRIPISWTYVSCAVPAGITYHFKDGSNPYWTAVQIRNHANQIASVAYRAKDGSYVPMTRQSYNYFLEEKGLGNEPPYAFRVTDVFGSVIEDDTIASIAESDFVSTKQFPSCAP
jgi:expansin (peptidoglycan-binding protein)